MSWSNIRNFSATVLLVAWYGWGLSRQIPEFLASLAVSGGSGSGDLAFIILRVVVEAAGIIFTTLLVILLIVRDTPKSRVQGVVPYAAAMVGTFASATAFFLPVARLPFWLIPLDAFLTLAGLVLSIWALSYLGKSFAILPSARRLVTSGPYRYVRHPLYVFEELAIIGIMLQFALPWSLVIVAIHVTAQLLRIRYEEKALLQAFPEYRAYAAATPRFIPPVSRFL
ncbi:MAG: isoprenylcysteine carboxylmethyltransferase family protein [Patescibacteria group bacterium]|nr:isoprenylcysteine carboxylmethyltransferase family protein [Patescibacteria group bacterium]